jgi:trimeric autotransporter adhesin
MNMKKFLALCGLILSVQFLFAQAPGLFNYQGVARNSVGNIIQNKTIALRLSVHNGSATGPVEYSEAREVTTNPFGLFNVLVGSPGARNGGNDGWHQLGIRSKIHTGGNRS